MTILVVGAANLIGTQVCGILCAKGHRVRAAVLPDSGDELERLRQTGAELLPGNCDTAAALAAMCHGVDAVVSTDAGMAPARPGTMLDPQAARGLVEFAHALGAGRFLYVTAPESFTVESLLLEARRELCGRLERRHQNHTVIAANFFMETWLSPIMGFDYPNGMATIYGDGTRPIAWVSSRDVAEFAVSVLEREDARGKSLPADGPRSMTPLDVVRLFEEATGRRFHITAVGEEELEDEYRSASDAVAKARAALKLEYARGCVNQPQWGTDRLFRPITTVEDYVRRVTSQVPTGK